MTHTQSQQIKTIRTIHRVTFNEGFSAETIKQYLSHVPDSAELVHISFDTEPHMTEMIFNDEREVEK